jgi:hypothetical protein
MLENLKDYIGIQSDWEIACDPVEAGAVRRFAQAIIDEDAVYGPSPNSRFGGPVAPPLYPLMMFRRPFGAPDPLHSKDPDFDGLGQSSSVTRGLPDIKPLAGYALLNGGSEIELFRYARHGEKVRMRSRYADISEKETSKGPIVLVVTEAEFETTDGKALMLARRTIIRRKPK